jgi:HK97 family phage major capsid protein
MSLTVRERAAEIERLSAEHQALIFSENLTPEQVTEGTALDARITALEEEQMQALSLEAQRERAATRQNAAATAHRVSLGATDGVTSTQGPANLVGAGPATNGQRGELGVGAIRAFTLPAHALRSRVSNFKTPETAYQFGQWLLATVRGNRRSQAFCRDHGIDLAMLDSENRVIQLSHTETVNTQGGFLVPPQFENDLIDLRERYGVVRRAFRNRTMTSDVLNVPRRTSGLTAYWVSDLVAITESTKGWDMVTLVAKKVGVLAKLSSELNEDAIINVADDLAGEIAYAFTLLEDQCGFLGDGTSTYGGIVGLAQAFLGLSATRANIAGLTIASGNLFSEFVLADFNATKAKLPLYAYGPNTKWYMHQSFYAGVVEKLMLAAGGVTEAGIGAGAPMRLMGYPVEPVQVMPSVEANDTIVAYFGDLSKAASFGDRRQTTIAMSEHSSFANDGLDIRGTERFDQNVHDVGNQSATAGLRVPGPVVALATAAS